MKKATKGAIAAGAAGALLLGGAGSLAFWSDSQTVTGGTITAGELGLTALDAGTWKLNGTTTLTPAQVAALRVVPGDSVVFTGSYDVRAQGDNLQATVTATGGAITGPLAAKLTTPTVVTTLDGQALTSITETNHGNDIVVTATFTFPFGTASDNTSQNLTANLSDVVIALAQTDATP
jgi:alternate signal-mediated exported protein